MKTYSVYEHVFPNGKRYIGISCEPEKRWNGGHGYDTQPKMKRAIQSYGWDNIEHNIICEGLPKEQAERLEMYLIDKLDTINNGYNVSIGGGKVKGYYLNENVLHMLREAEIIYKEYGRSPKKEGITIQRFFEEGKTNRERSELVNIIDGVIEKHWYMSGYKRYPTLPNLGVDGRLRRHQAYFYYAANILWQLDHGFCDPDRIKPFECAVYEMYWGKENPFNWGWGQKDTSVTADKPYTAGKQ